MKQSHKTLLLWVLLILMFFAMPLLIFTLGRPDVLPVDDFGVREGFKIAYGRRKQPTPKQLRRYGVRWSPYRSIAAWYLWRAAEKALHRKIEPAVT